MMSTSNPTPQTTTTTTTTTTTSNNTNGNFLTRSKGFQKLVKYTFEICDRNKTGQVNKTELYVGLILVHLKLAKYAGPAACYPPTRDSVDKLFDAADLDNSGGIDEMEFVSIIGICCAQILSRMLCYYTVLVLLVPIVVTRIVDLSPITNGSYIEMTIEQVTSLLLFYLIIPLLWNTIDTKSEQVAASGGQISVSELLSTTTTTREGEGEGEEKKDDNETTDKKEN